MVQRRLTNHVVPGVVEGNKPGEGKEKNEPEILFRLLGIPRVTMRNAAQSIPSPLQSEARAAPLKGGVTVIYVVH